MKKIIGTAVAILVGLSLTVGGAQMAAACSEGEETEQVLRASAESESADAELYLDIKSNGEEGDYPVSVGAGNFDGTTWCSDGTLQAVEDGAEDPEGFVEALIDFLGHLLP